ncbi:MAG: amidohydrolase [Candidatus Odinarchaeia archaeon]
METMLVNGTILTLDKQMHRIKDGTVVIEGERIVEVGKTREIKSKYHGYDKINVKGKVLMPAMVNCHTHAAMTLLRGYADDLPLHEWLYNKIFPLESKLTKKEVYVGAKLAAVESALSGVGCLNTMYHYVDAEAEAISEVGLRAVVGHVCFSFRKKEDIRTTRKLVEEWHNKKDGLIRVSVDPHAVYTVDPEYLVELKELKDELNEKHGKNAPIIWHIHAAETGIEMEKAQEAASEWEKLGVKSLKEINFNQGVFEYLESLNVLGPDVIAAHCVYLNDRDIEIIAKNKVKVAHNPVSNLKLASGISPIPKLISKGIDIGLGTDGACSNNSLDMIETIKLTALLHKGVTLSPTVVPATKALRMATIEGAKAILWDNEIGSIEPNKKADIAVLDFKKPHLTPLYDEYSHIVYALKSSDVDTLIINGKLILEHREFKTVDLDKLLYEVIETKENLLSSLS